jgi:murein DD-endopeptidase MepM/ murein hydrolase activator NlpD
MIPTLRAAAIILPMLVQPAGAAPNPPALQAPTLQAPALQAPVRPACISSPFGQRHAVGPRAPAGFHRGIDLPAPAGGLVRAAATGEVATIRRAPLGGLEVVLVHGGGWRTLYAHLGSVVPALAEGRRHVRAGAPLGRVGRSGITYGTHLFFEVLDGGRPVDPAPLLGVAPCRPPAAGR